MAGHKQALITTQSVRRGMSLLACLLLAACAGTPEKPQQDPFTLLEEADKAYSRGEWFNAERAYQQLTEQVPDDAYAWLRLGNVRLQQGRLEAAIAAYQSSLRQDQEQVRAYYNLATSYMLKAQQALQQAQRNMLPRDPGQQHLAERLARLKALFSSGIVEGRSPGQGLRQSVRPDQTDNNAPKRE